MEIFLLFMFLVALSVFFYKAQLRKAREKHFNHLMEKYNNDANIVSKIINKTIWQGESAEQLKDSLGAPEDIDQKVLKSLKREIWKYNPIGRNKYGLRITLENDLVIGWESK